MKSICAFLFVILLSSGLGTAAEYDYDYSEDGDYSYTSGTEEESPAPQAPLPVFQDEPQTFTIRVGDNVTLPCRNTNNGDHVLIINKLDMDESAKPVLIMAGESIFQNKNRFGFADNLLTISNVIKRDSGKYECSFQHPSGDRVTLLHTIDVLFEPTMFKKQRTITAKKGESVKVVCVAGGNPKPTITWSKQDGEMPSGADQESGKSITFLEADRHIAGTYMCTADNGVGNAVTATREVIIDYMPEIETEKERIHTGNGDKIELVCIVHAHPTAEVEWRRNNQVFGLDTIAEVFEGGHRHVLTIEAVTEEDFGTYDCIANNKFGSSSQSINVTDAPSTPVITSDPHSAEEESYTLTWTSESFYPITQYTLMFRKAKVNDTVDQPGEWMNIEEQVAEQQTAGEQAFQNTLNDLERATDYEAKLYVKNSIKDSAPVEFFFSTRKEQADPQSTSSATNPTSVSLFMAFSYLTLRFLQ